MPLSSGALTDNANEMTARRSGFSCALEMRWAEDAAAERAEHGCAYGG